MRVKIVSDGTAAGTHILDEAGQELENIAHIEWQVAAGSLSCAKVTLVGIPVLVEGKLRDGMRWLFGEVKTE
jgi:hypothetical protein